MASALRPVTPVGILEQQLGELAGVARRLSAGLGSADAGSDGALQRALSDARLLEEGLHRSGALAGGLEPYLAEGTSPESPGRARLAAATAAHDWAGPDGSQTVPVEAEMLSGHVEGELLAMLVAATGARRVLEIGMFTGYAALAMAEALPVGGTVIACELDPGVADFARARLDEAEHGDRISIRVGPALETLEHLAAAGESFDLVFLDADKAGYQTYVEALLDHRLLAPGGLLVVDNTLMQGEPWSAAAAAAGEPGEAIRTFNAWLAQEPRVRQVMLPLRDGVTLVRWAAGA